MHDSRWYHLKKYSAKIDSLHAPGWDARKTWNCHLRLEEPTSYRTLWTTLALPSDVDDGIQTYYCVHEVAILIRFNFRKSRRPYARRLKGASRTRREFFLCFLSGIANDDQPLFDHPFFVSKLVMHTRVYMLFGSPFPQWRKHIPQEPRRNSEVASRADH